MSEPVPPGGAGTNVPRDSLREARPTSALIVQLEKVSRRVQLLRSTLEDARAQAEAEDKRRGRRDPPAKKVPGDESSLEASQHLGLAAWGHMMARTGLWMQLQHEHDMRAAELHVDEEELPRLQQAASVRPHPTRSGSFRVLHWNVLAEGLSDDGFFVRDVMRKDLPDLPCDTVSFEEMIAEVSKAKKENGDLESLKIKYDTPRSRANYGAVLDWRRRWAQMRAFIVASAPDIIALQELDHMADAQRELGALGYTCSLAGSDSPYRPIHKEITGKLRREDKAFLAHLHATGVAFVPKTFSNCRKFGLKTNADADDDGVAIFWREDAFKATSMDFLSFDDPKRNQVPPCPHCTENRL